MFEPQLDSQLAQEELLGFGDGGVQLFIGLLVDIVYLQAATTSRAPSYRDRGSGTNGWVVVMGQ